VRVIVPGREINGGNTKFRGNNRNIRERANGSFETFRRNVLFKIGIIAIVVDSIIKAFSVNFNVSMINLSLSKSEGRNLEWKQSQK
jgi:hypothetical protein